MFGVCSGTSTGLFVEDPGLGYRICLSLSDMMMWRFLPLFVVAAVVARTSAILRPELFSSSSILVD
jgi:hypothetical protein